MSTPMGSRLRRREDPRLVQGQGRYVGDLHPPGLLYAAFVRSPHAHARVTTLRAETARAMPGVAAVFGAADLPALGRPMPPLFPHPGVQMRLAAPLACDVVRYAGEAVAVVVADDPYRAADAAAAVAVAYDPLPVVASVEQALRDGAPLVYADVPGNVAGRITTALGDGEAAFAAADTVLRERFSIARAAGAAIEPRTLMAQPGGEGDDTAVTLWDSTQAPHTVRRCVAAALDLPEPRVRVVAPEVGGGFGPKGRVYAEEIVLAAVALHLRRPISWVATRAEDLLTTYHGRDQVIEAELAARADGTLLGLRARITQDCGAYLATGVIVPLNSAQHLIGPYRLPAYDCEIVAVYTNKTPLTPLRGGGRPQGVFVMERLLDHLARELGRDPLEVRRRNLLEPGDFPYDTGYPARAGSGTVVYDSGNYPACLKRARAMIGYDGVRRAQPEERRAGRYRGVAVTAFLESTGTGEEGARVEVGGDGAVRVTVGSPSLGQSHATTLAQVCAAQLGVSAEQIGVVSGDTAAFEQGVGTFASRMAVMAGNAVAGAAREVRRSVLREAAALLEVSADDLELSDGAVTVRGVPERSLTLAQVARSLAARGDDARLRATYTFAPERPTAFSGGAHAAVVEVDAETGAVRIERYVVVHDCGTIINPTVVEGQIRGGVAHGIGNALYESIVYDEAGQLLSGSFMDYAMPDAPMVPHVEVAHLETPSPFNPLGIKGAGEGGTIGALATIAGAVEDALSPFGVTLNSLPLRAEDLARATGALARHADRSPARRRETV